MLQMALGRHMGSGSSKDGEVLCQSVLLMTRNRCSRRCLDGKVPCWLYMYSMLCEETRCRCQVSPGTLGRYVELLRSTLVYEDPFLIYTISTFVELHEPLVGIRASCQVTQMQSRYGKEMCSRQSTVIIQNIPQPISTTIRNVYKHIVPPSSLRSSTTRIPFSQACCEPCRESRE